MSSRVFTTKLLSVFLVVFVCLNAGGALCVAYCQSFGIADIEKDHCPLAKLDDHCKKASQTSDGDSVSIAENEMGCCPLTVSFLAAPVEPKQITTNLPAGVPTAEPFAGFESRIVKINPRTISSYRGPPKDKRVDRIKNCILRI